MGLHLPDAAPPGAAAALKFVPLKRAPNQRIANTIR